MLLVVCYKYGITYTQASSCYYDNFFGGPGIYKQINCSVYSYQQVSVSAVELDQKLHE